MSRARSNAGWKRRFWPRPVPGSKRMYGGRRKYRWPSDKVVPRRIQRERAIEEQT